MLDDYAETRRLLQRIAWRLTTDSALHEDLIQEGLIHFWQRIEACPGQNQNWYLQSCRFFLQNYLRKGRSVDSTRRRNTLFSYAEPDACAGSSSDGESASSNSVVALVSAREIDYLIVKWLTPLERQILIGLAEGFGVRETAARLNVSHTSVIRHRRRIAALALKLGIEPLPKPNGRQHRRGADFLIELRK